MQAPELWAATRAKRARRTALTSYQSITIQKPVSFSPSPVTGGAKPAMFIISQSKVSHPVWHPLCLFTGKTPTIQNTLSLSLSLWIESLFSPSLLSRAKLSPSINLRVLNSEMNRVMCIFYFNFIYILIQKNYFRAWGFPLAKWKMCSMWGKGVSIQNYNIKSLKILKNSWC